MYIDSTIQNYFGSGSLARSVVVVVARGEEVLVVVGRGRSVVRGVEVAVRAQEELLVLGAAEPLTGFLVRVIRSSSAAASLLMAARSVGRRKESISYFTN